tara:strand:- start:148 stop:1026 length:879 start_codon:yes stop_codon:yes gene_type:complete
MSISSLVGRIIPAVTGFVTSGGNPIAAAGSFIAADQARDAAKEARLQNEIATNRYMENLQMIGLDAFGGTGRNITPMQPAPQPGFFSRLGGIASNVGDTLLSGLEASVPSVINRAIFGGTRPQTAAQGPALTTVTNVGAQESQGSGSIQAGFGSLLPQVLAQGRNLLKTPGGQLALGTGVGSALSFMGSDGKQMRITRKMKSQARTVLNIAGGNISVAADILNISDEMLIQILLKRFRNDGPVVTKAALRKTKSTIRKLHSMQDVLKSITPTASGRKRTPMKRAMSTTLIKN